MGQFWCFCGSSFWPVLFAPNRGAQTGLRGAPRHAEVSLGSSFPGQPAWKGHRERRPDRRRVAGCRGQRLRLDLLYQGTPPDARRRRQVPAVHRNLESPRLPVHRRRVTGHGRAGGRGPIRDAPPLLSAARPRRRLDRLSRPRARARAHEGGVDASGRRSPSIDPARRRAWHRQDATGVGIRERPSRIGSDRPRRSLRRGSARVVSTVCRSPELVRARVSGIRLARAAGGDRRRRRARILCSRSCCAASRIFPHSPR